MFETWVAGDGRELLSEFTKKKPVPEVVSRERIYEYGLRIQRPLPRALFYFLYLTGARITEALFIQRRDIQSEVVEGNKIVTVNLRTLKKRRGTKVRIIPIWVDEEKNPEEYKMYSYVKNFITMVDTGYIFSFPGRADQVRKRIGYYFGKDIEITTRAIHNMKFLDEYTFRMYPHYLRHCRLTHLAQLYGFNELRLMTYAGWSSTKPASLYVHLNWLDLFRAMKGPGS